MLPGVAALLDRLEKRLGAGVGDGAEVLHQFVVRHADAVVGDGQGLGLLVGGDVDFQRQRRLMECFLGGLDVAELFHRVRGVGNQLAEEDFLVGVE
jgi:hypothetical protein